MTAALSAGHVKSARRVLEVFEYFNGGRQTATVMEISRRCGYPQSSASKLLSCLAGLGYLHHDRFTRTYRPTARVALLGSWVQPHLFRRGALLRMVDELADETDCEVWLGAQVGLEVQILQAVAPKDLKLRTGRSNSSCSLLRSPLGRVLLSSFDSAHARKLVHRLNADAPDDKKLSWPELATELTEIRAQGHALTRRDWDCGADAGCAVLLPQQQDEDRLALFMRPGGSALGNLLAQHAHDAISRCLTAAITQ